MTLTGENPSARGIRLSQSRFVCQPA